ncbi:12287_t:CDS:2 [Gigaspora rosea]|nr:12287_t:CDS:2 [Gigaspora rosea]
MSKQSAQQTRYGGGETDDYSSDSDVYSDNISESGSENCSDYGSDYESDNETNTIESPISQPPKVEELMSNTTYSTKQVSPTYSKRQERFDDKFTQKDLLNKIREIASSPARDISNNKGSLEDIHLWDYLLPNYGAKEGISLLDAYKREELADKLVIQVEQGKYKKFSVIDDISEVYGVPGVHECINGQRALRPVIDIDAPLGDMEAEKVKARDVFIRICVSFVRALYIILDCSWEEIFKGLVIATSSDDNKCSYHLLYTPILLIDYLELKEFTELVYKLTGKKYGKFIDMGLPGRNFNLRLIGSAKNDRVKRILQFSLDNGWNDLNDTRVQPPASAGFEVRPRILSVEKINNQKKIIVGQDVLKKYANLVLQKYPDYLGGWDIEEKNSQWYVYFNRKTYLECPLCNRTHDKDQRWFGRAYGNGSFIVKCFQQNRDESGEIYNDPSIAEKIQQKNKNNTTPPVSYKIKSPKFPKPFLNVPPQYQNINDSLTTTMAYKDQYIKTLPEIPDIYVGSPWGTGKTYALEKLNTPQNVSMLVVSTRHSYSNAITTRLNLESYCDIDGPIHLSKHQRVVCQVESLHRVTDKCECREKCKCPKTPYILILDEIVSIIAQTGSCFKGAYLSLSNFFELIYNASRIIALDNDLTDRNIEWIKTLRPNKTFTVIHNTYQPQKDKTFRLAPDRETVLTELWDWGKQMSSLPFEERRSASLICHERRDVQGSVRGLRNDFPELRIKEYHGGSNPVEKTQDFKNVEEAWKEVDLVAYTSTLKIGVSCTYSKFERAFCLFTSYIETNAGTNQMLFRMRCIKNYICYIQQRASRAPTTEEELFQWLTEAKRGCLPKELQNKGVFPNIETIIKNKDVPTIQLWVAFMLEKFRSQRLFGWRMVDFLKKAGMIVSIMESIPKSENNDASLSKAVRVCSSIVKAEEISDIANADILDHEMAERLENSSKKSLNEIHALRRYHIAECYEHPPESLTEEFIAEYGNPNHMKWFRAFRKLRDAGINNETAVEAITREDFRDDKLTTVTRAEKHRICLELLKTCTPVKDIDDRDRYTADIVKSCLESSKSMKYLQALSATYGIKFKATNNKRTHYHLVGPFDKESAPKLLPYQTGEGQFYENGEDMRYGYSKLSPDELEPSPNCISQNTQDLFDIV